MIETKCIKFYLSDKVNKVKKDKIVSFLQECQTVENFLLEYYWNNFQTIIESRTKIDMNYNNTINFKDTTPILKSHHFYAVLEQSFWVLKSIEEKINKQIHFKFEDKIKQRVYNYCKGFCFQWDKLIKSVCKESKKNKKDKNYQMFIFEVLKYINDDKKFIQLKQDVENKFWEIKANYKTPVKKELQIWVSTWLTTVVEKKEFEWIFIIDNNEKRTKKIYDSIVIPIKLSDYHKKILDGKQIKNSLNLKLNKYNKIEITVVYDEEINYPEPNPKDYIGIDIGLKNLITDSNGVCIEQNKDIIDRAEKVVKKQSNRQTLEEHLKIKYDDKNYKLSDKRYIKQQCKLSEYVKNDNRYKVKEYIKTHTDYHIVMEKLEIGYIKTYDKKTNYLLRRLRVQHLVEDILNYGKKIGVKISQVNPAFTSQTCPCCGHISKNNRKTQETFCCVECDYTANADVNASVNIKNRLFDERIKLNTPFWKVKEILRMD